MNLRRLRQWFAWPDVVRSPWKRRLVWGVPFVLVLAGVVAWRALQPTLGEDVKLVNVSREEAVRIVKAIRRERNELAFGNLRNGELRDWYNGMRAEVVVKVEVLKDGAFVQTRKSGIYWLKRQTNGWSIEHITGAPF